MAIMNKLLRGFITASAAVFKVFYHGSASRFSLQRLQGDTSGKRGHE